MSHKTLQNHQMSVETIAIETAPSMKLLHAIVAWSAIELSLKCLSRGHMNQNERGSTKQLPELPLIK